MISLFNLFKSTFNSDCSSGSCFLEELEIEPSDSVIFGISKKEEYDYFERDGYINRLCLSYGLQEFNKAFEDFKWA